MSKAEYGELFQRVRTHIERRYRVPVGVGEIAGGNIGAMDGATIRLDPGLEPEKALYFLLHLFGHTVQWNLDPEFRALGALPNPTVVERGLERLHGYEIAASGHALALLHELGVTHLDAWLSDYFASDWRFLKHLYLTGERLPWSETFRPGEPVLEPLPIPEFTPEARAAAYSF